MKGKRILAFGVLSQGTHEKMPSCPFRIRPIFSVNLLELEYIDGNLPETTIFNKICD